MDSLWLYIIGDLDRGFLEVDSQLLLFSPSVMAWQLQSDVLAILYKSASHYLVQGNPKKAHSKAREGAMLAKRTVLRGW